MLFVANTLLVHYVTSVDTVVPQSDAVMNEPQVIDVINVYNVYKKNRCKRVYYFVNVYLSKNHMSETKQNYDSDEDN